MKKTLKPYNFNEVVLKELRKSGEVWKTDSKNKNKYWGAKYKDHVSFFGKANKDHAQVFAKGGSDLLHKYEIFRKKKASAALKAKKKAKKGPGFFGKIAQKGRNLKHRFSKSNPNEFKGVHKNK